MEDKGIQLSVQGDLKDGQLYLLREGVLGQIGLKGEFVEEGVYMLKQGVFVQMKRNLESSVPKPSRQVFATGVVNQTEMSLKWAPQPVYGFVKAEYPEEKDGGGIYVYLDGLKYPTKGFPFPEAIMACGGVKKILIGHLRFFWKNWLAAISLLKRSNLESFLFGFNNTAHNILQSFYLVDFRYTKAARQIRIFVEKFLLGVGISENNAQMFALTFATLLEYDDAYRLRFQDLADETSVEKLKKNPVGELKRLVQILKERDTMERKDRKKISKNFGIVVKLFSWACYLPVVLRAWRSALDAVDLSQIQTDEGDRYYMLRWKWYAFGGRSDEDRHAEFEKMHEGNMPKQYLLKVN